MSGMEMAPPRDDLIQRAGAYPHRLCQKTGNVYGLSNSPRLWTRMIIKRMLNKGFKQHGFDRMLFYMHKDMPDGSFQLICMVLVYVDDFLVTYDEIAFDIKIIEEMFDWGTITRHDVKTPVNFKAKDIETFEADGVFKVRLTRRKFIEAMEPVVLPCGRLSGSPSLSRDEQGDFRSVCRSLQRLASQTRLDGGSAVSLSNKGAETDINDFKQLISTMEHVKQSRPAMTGAS